MPAPNLINDVTDLIASTTEVEQAKFVNLALDTFAYQYNNVGIYRKFCDQLGKNPDAVHKLEDIPYLPIEFFKNHNVFDESLTVQKIFQSSGTSSNEPSFHKVCDLSIYNLSLLKTFEIFFGDPGQYCILALLPSYLERDNASLVYMVEQLMNASSHWENGYYLNDADALRNKLTSLTKRGVKTILFGVTFALVDLMNKWETTLPYTTIIETGGMKGRQQEITRTTLHKMLRENLNPAHICSEYGMTELLSQSYAMDSEEFKCPPWMQISIRDVQDPFSYLITGKTGGLNILDLANIYSCSFIATQDLGRCSKNGFEVLGRFDNSDIRGCNLMITA